MKLLDNKKITWIVLGAITLGIMNGIIFRFYPKSFSVFAYVLFIFIPLLAVVLIVFIRFSLIFLSKISEKEQEEAVLQRRQKEIVENMVEGLIVHDLKGNILNVNGAAEKILGLSESKLKGKTLREINNPPALLTAVFQEPENWEEIEYSFTNESGQELSFQISKVTLSKEKGEILKIIRDITRSRYLDRMKTEYITIISHKFLTPLTNIKWAADAVLKNNFDKEKSTDNLKNITSNAEKLVKLTSSLLNITDIEEGLFGYKFEKFDIIHLVEEVIQNYSDESLQKGIKVSFLNTESHSRVVVEGDRNRLSAAIANYLDNAIKYTPEGGKIDIIFEAKGESVKISVKDSGIGISPESIDSLFSKFFRDKLAKTLHTEGSGLGLFIVKNIIERHGGATGYAPNEGEPGSTFYFTLPIAKEK